MEYGKGIELFLTNGTPYGIITAKLPNWNGKAIKVPRLEFASCDIKDIKNAGVYFLFCKEDDSSDSVYIGESENVKEKLEKHVKDYQLGREKFYWDIALIFIGADLNKELIRYLEYRIIDISRKCDSYKVLSQSKYIQKDISESQIAIIEEFIDNVKILTYILNYKLLEPKADKKDYKDNMEYFYCSNNRGAEGKALIKDKKIIVLKGSKIATKLTESFIKGNYYNLYKTLNDNRTIEDGVFTIDYSFLSYTAASSVVLGVPSNGGIEWKTKDGIKLKEIDKS